MIKAIARFILALNGNAKKSEVAAGLTWGLCLGLIPAGNLFWIALFFVSFFFRHNHWLKLIAMVVMIIISQAVFRLTDIVGWWVLNIDSLQPIYTKWYNMPFVPFTNFNNTLVAGGLVASVALCIPLFLLFMALVSLYRNKLAEKIKNSKFMKFFVKMPFISSVNKQMIKMSGGA